MQGHGSDIFGAQFVLIAQLDGGINGRMGDNTAGERLVGVERGLEPRAQSFGDFSPIDLARQRLRPAILAFQGMRVGGVILGRHQRGGQAVLGGASRMKGLGHRTELDFQSHRL